MACRFQLRLRHLGSGAELLELFVGYERRVCFLQRREAVVVALCLRKRRLRLRRLRSRAGDSSGRALDVRLILSRIDLEQELPLGHHIAVLHRQPHDASGDVGAQVDLGVRLHLAARSHRSDEVSSRDFLDADLGRLVPALHRAGDDDQQQRQCNCAEYRQLRSLAHKMISD